MSQRVDHARGTGSQRVGLRSQGHMHNRNGNRSQSVGHRRYNRDGHKNQRVDKSASGKGTTGVRGLATGARGLTTQATTGKAT
jgi:hypothetical protein